MSNDTLINCTDQNLTMLDFGMDAVSTPPHSTGSPILNRYSTLAMILTVIPVSILIIVIVSGNTLVIAAVLWDAKLKSQMQNWLIVSLAIADLLVGLLIMPLTLTYELLDYWVLGEDMCELWLASDVLFVTASILNLCAISLDRYWSLTDPVYTTQRTSKRILFMIGCVWIFSFLVCCPLIAGWRATQGPTDQCMLSEDLGYVLYSSFGSFFIPVVTLLFVYSRIYRITRKRARRNMRRSRTRNELLHVEENSKSRRNGIANVSGAVTGGLLSVAWNVAAITRGSMEDLPSISSNLLSPAATSNHIRSFSVASQKTRMTKSDPYQRDPVAELIKTGSKLSLHSDELQRQIGTRRKIMRKRERQATSLLGLIVLAFIGCWMPFFCIYLLRAVCCKPPDLLFDIIFWLGYCNSAFNPFIYNYFNPEFRQAFVKILLPKKRQRR